MPLPAGIAAVLLDVEGTTTSIAFVFDVLFPYAAARLEEYCSRPAPEPELAAALARLKAEYDAEGREAMLLPFGAGAGYARRLMAEDRKSTGLKLLQGLIWEEAYRSGELRGHVCQATPSLTS